MRTILIIIFLLMYHSLPAQVPPDTIDEDSFDWTHWDFQDWEKQIDKDKYRKKNIYKTYNQAEQYAKDEGIDMPIRKGIYTYLPDADTFLLESTADYIGRLSHWVDDYLSKDAGKVILDAGLALLYQQIEPIVAAFAKQNEKYLKKTLPPGEGVLTWDFIIRKPITRKAEESEKSWVRIIAEEMINDMVEKNADGTYSIQRENLEYMKQVGIINYLKMSVLNWELVRAIELEVPKEVLDYATMVKTIYNEGKGLVDESKSLYRQLHDWDLQTAIPEDYRQWKALSEGVFENKMTLNEMALKRKKQLALTYQQLSGQYKEDAIDLKARILSDDELKMSDSERTKALQIVEEYLQEAIRLKAKADQMLQESIDPVFLDSKHKVAGIYSVYQTLQQQYEK